MNITKIQSEYEIMYEPLLYRCYQHVWWGTAVQRHYRKNLVHLIPDQKIALMGVGCGPWYALNLLKEEEYVITFGMDISLNTLEMAKNFE